MFSLLRQCGAVASLNLKSIPERAAMSLSTIAAVAIAVSILIGFLALSRGFESVLEGSGSTTTAVILRGGALSELNSVVDQSQARIVEDGPGIARNANGQALVSAELFLVVDGIKRTTGLPVNVPLRGIGPLGLELRKGFKIVEGRMFAEGSNEIVVGKALLKEFTGFELGQEVRFGTSVWKVVGVFEAPGSVFESELWADARVIANIFNRGTAIQTIRAQLTSADKIDELAKFVKEDPRLQFEAKSEKQFYADQAGGTAAMIDNLGWPLGIIMAIGALAGALNTMYSSVASRASEIATLRILGFSGFAAFFGTLVEALALAILGGLLGCGVMYLLFNGMTASTMGGSFTQVVFQLQFTVGILIAALVVALIIGLIGGIFPGVRAARQSPLLALGQ